MKKQKLLVLVLVVIMSTTLLSGCNTQTDSPPSATPTPPDISAELEKSKDVEVDTTRKSTANTDERYDKIVWHIPSDPQDLKPYDMNGARKRPFCSVVYESLFELDGSEYVPELAKGYTEVDDLHWDVEIWDNIYDHKGNHITSSDVVYSYNWLIDNGYQKKYDVFESIEALDEYTVRFTWSKPVDSLGELEWPWCCTAVFSEESYNTYDFATEPVGTGPYYVSNYVSGSKVVVEAYDDYWQKDESALTIYKKQNVQTMEFVILSEQAQVVIALQTGAIDITKEVTAENVGYFADGGEYSADYDVYNAPSDMAFALVCNQSEGKITNDINFRLAVSYAIDNASIGTAVGGVLGATAFGSPKCSDYNTEWDSLDNYVNTFNLELAKEYLAQTDYNNETLIIKYSTTAAPAGMPELIQGMLQVAGIQTQLEPRDEGMIDNELLDADGWDICIKGGGNPYLISGWNVFLNNGEYGNGKALGFIADDNLQSQYDLCKTLEGHTVENMNALHQYVIDNCYLTPLAFKVEKIVYNSNKFASLIIGDGNVAWLNACDYYLD